jgi:hypothetical protein
VKEGGRNEWAQVRAAQDPKLNEFSLTEQERETETILLWGTQGLKTKLM